jgi:hypothetical protein
LADRELGRFQIADAPGGLGLRWLVREIEEVKGVLRRRSPEVEDDGSGHISEKGGVTP